MAEGFNAEQFAKKLLTGELDGRLQEEFGKLSQAQLEQVAMLIAELAKRATGSPF